MRQLDERQRQLALRGVLWAFIALIVIFFFRKLQEQVSHLDRVGSRWPVIL